MSCCQKFRVVSVQLFHAAFPVLPNSKLSWLFVQLVQIHNEQSFSYHEKSETLFWLLIWTDGIFLVVGNWQYSTVHFAVSFQGRIGRTMFHHLWWHGPKCQLASLKGLGKLWLQFKLRHSRGGTPNHTQTVIDATQKETAIDQQHSCETLICQRHQTILRLLSSAATASTRWRVREINCPTTYEGFLMFSSLHPHTLWHSFYPQYNQHENLKPIWTASVISKHHKLSIYEKATPS